MNWSPNSEALRGRVAVVAGATRGAGRGIAAALGERARPSIARVAQVEAFAERLRKERGRIDVLVNDIWGAEVLKGGPPDWNKPAVPRFSLPIP
jgi:NAD(P)-dependent dehydrogenase (short-subunit alcohol dehydrogenase family)